MSQDLTPFWQASAELRKLGITLRQLPGEYAVNFANAAESTARNFETLEEALAGGRIMAAERAEASSTKGRGPRRRPYRPRTAKAYNRWLRKKHMRKLLRASAAKQKRAVTQSLDKPG